MFYGNVERLIFTYEKMGEHEFHNSTPPYCQTCIFEMSLE